MNHTATARSFALLVGVFLLIEGVWGMFSSVVFGVFTTNVTHAVIHLVLGLIGIGAALRGHAPAFLGFLGVLLLLVGILWFIPATRHLPTDLFNANRAVAVLNVVIGGIALGMAKNARRATAF